MSSSRGAQGAKVVAGAVALLIAVLAFPLSASADFEETPIGWASVEATYREPDNASGSTVTRTTTTGGEGGIEYVVDANASPPAGYSTVKAYLKDLMFSSYDGHGGTSPRIIYIIGTIDFGGGQEKVASNKTILGVGSDATILNGGFLIDNDEGTRPMCNIIVRNLTFTSDAPLVVNPSSTGPDDFITIVDRAHHVWIDHCDFSNGYDGLLDITHGCDEITVSWSHFYDHISRKDGAGKTCLLGHDDTNGSEDIGHLTVTYHHNWFDGTASRHPRVRFSRLCHAFNNYYLSNSYGVASTCNAEVLVEGNYFQSVGSPTLVGYGASPDGDLVQRLNAQSGSGSYETRGTVPEPSLYYSYTLDTAADVPTIVSAGAGVGKLSITAPETPTPTPTETPTPTATPPLPPAGVSDGQWMLY